MGKGMKLPFLSHSKSFNPKTLSFSPPCKDNSAFLDSNSSSSRTSWTIPEEDMGDPVEGFVKGLRSERFFFEPEQRSLLVGEKLRKSGKEVETEENRVEYKKSEILWVDCSKPFGCSSGKQVEREEKRVVGYKESGNLGVGSSNTFDSSSGKEVETEENRGNSVVGHKEREMLLVNCSDPFDYSYGKQVKTKENKGKRENRVFGYKESENSGVDSSNTFDCSYGKQVETKENKENTGNRVVGYRENEILRSGKQVETEENRVFVHNESEILWVDSPNPFEDSKPSLPEIVDPENCNSFLDDRLTKTKVGCSSTKQAKTEQNRAKNRVLGYKQTEMLCLDSCNPFEDFKQSMLEMVEAHSLMKDWEGLEELLSCYLEINGENNHGYILGAFIDLLASFVPPLQSSSTTTTTMLSSSVSSSSSPSSPMSLHSSCITARSCSSA